VLVCYLDDSGKDRQNPITAVAGYIAKDDGWKTFESEVEPIFVEPENFCPARQGAARH
jgi:hypothetical protein